MKRLMLFLVLLLFPLTAIAGEKVSGSWGEGICVYGAGDDTLTDYWKRDQGQEVGQWKYLSGTGKFAGIAGAGTYKNQPSPDGYSISAWEGEVTLPE